MHCFILTANHNKTRLLDVQVVKLCDLKNLLSDTCDVQYLLLNATCTLTTLGTSANSGDHPRDYEKSIVRGDQSHGTFPPIPLGCVATPPSSQRKLLFLYPLSPFCLKVKKCGLMPQSNTSVYRPCSSLIASFASLLNNLRSPPFWWIYSLIRHQSLNMDHLALAFLSFLHPE